MACGSRTALDVGTSVDAGMALARLRDASLLDGTDLDAATLDATASDVHAPVDATPAPSHFGLVQAWGTLPGLSGPDEVWADFYEDEALPPACALVGPSGTCSVVTCPGQEQPVSTASLNAGTLVASVAGSPTTYPYDGVSPTGTYPESNVDAIFTTGDTMTFTGPGGPDVPPFGISVTAPDLSQLDPPWFTTEVTIDTTVDLPISWSASASGDAVFSVGDASGHELVCFFDAAAGAGVVPEANLAALKALVNGAAVNAEFFVASRVTTRVGEWQIQATGVIWYGATVSQFGAVLLQ
jgi:hypothetical protein